VYLVQLLGCQQIIELEVGDLCSSELVKLVCTFMVCMSDITVSGGFLEYSLR
jgi:hypothetical protein